MRSVHFALVLCVLAVTVAPAFGGDLESVDGDEALGVPRVMGALAPKVRIKLQRAYLVAVDHVRNNPECRDLFAELGANGLEKLSTTLYSQSTARVERRFCQGGVNAIAFIESPLVRLCRRFASLGVEQAATVLIHEALHFAGMGEWPRDPQGLNSREINALVKRSCGL